MLMRCFIGCALILIASNHAGATTDVVNPEGTWDFPTIQVIDASVDGDTIELTDGTFQGIQPLGIIYWGKTIPIHSQSGNPETVFWAGRTSIRHRWAGHERGLPTCN